MGGGGGGMIMMMWVVKGWRFREESVNFYAFAKRTRSSIVMCDIKKHSSSNGKKQIQR
jgi:hypothetical protein